MLNGPGSFFLLLTLGVGLGTIVLVALVWVTAKLLTTSGPSGRSRF